MKRLSALSAFACLLFTINSNAETYDQRIAIELPEKLRVQALTNMRDNLTTVQGIVNALAQEDFEAVSKLASRLGRMEHTEDALQRRRMMPEGYRSIGPKMHLGFQAIARDARDFGDVQHSLEQLSTLMNTCVSCHSQYRFSVSK